ncbi:NUDIX hydrolase [Leucobacter salsicius]|uniref:NUDIX hydrolase n=1 Tax=Leucobacter salsicius TaxID=664638 RepID=UPI00034A4D43|nr:CoA pyrophosphatase [Leucobacter salsicius]
MSPTPGDALRDLRALMARGVTLDFQPQGPLADRPLRRSAVLILFGALDQVPAHAPYTVAPELDVLLTRRATGMRHHAGQIAFPGGGWEPGDADSAATALREAQEETGLDPTGVEVLGELPEIHLPVSNNRVTPVVGWWHAPSEVSADRTESVDVFRAPVAELLAPAARGTSVLRRKSATGPAITHRGDAFRLAPRLGGHIVWGFTGILLATLFDELGWARPWDPDQEFPVQP